MRVSEIQLLLSKFRLKFGEKWRFCCKIWRKVAILGLHLAKLWPFWNLRISVAKSGDFGDQSWLFPKNKTGNPGVSGPLLLEWTQEECRKETEVRQVNDWSGPFLTDLGVNLFCFFSLTDLLPHYPTWKPTGHLFTPVSTGSFSSNVLGWRASLWIFLREKRW